MKIFVSLLLLIFVFLLGGCKQSKQSETEKLLGSLGSGYIIAKSAGSNGFEAIYFEKDKQNIPVFDTLNKLSIVSDSLIAYFHCRPPEHGGIGSDCYCNGTVDCFINKIYCTLTPCSVHDCRTEPCSHISTSPAIKKLN